MSTYTLIVTWLVSAMSLWAQPGLSPMSRVAISNCDETCQKARACDGPGIVCRPPVKWGNVWTRQETKEEGTQRYEALAEAITRVAFDPAEKPLFDGPSGRAKTALWMAAVAWGESGLRRDVGEGVGPKSRGDNGSSFCQMQIHLPGATKWEGLTGKDLLASYDACFRAGLHILRASRCTSTKTETGKWSGYRGHCNDRDALTRMRLDAMRRALTRLPVPAADAALELPAAGGGNEEEATEGPPSAF